MLLRDRFLATLFPMVVWGLLMGSALLGAESAETQLKTLADETREYFAAASQYAKENTTRRGQVQKELALIKDQYETSGDNFAREILRKKKLVLEKELSGVPLDLAKHQVEEAQKGVSFAERKLEIMKQRLREIENKGS